MHKDFDLDIQVISESQVYASITFSEKINLSYTWYMTNYPKNANWYGIRDALVTGPPGVSEVACIAGTRRWPVGIGSGPGA